MRVRRTRRIDAPAEAVWSTVSDPWSLPRWWPRTERVESVGAAGWTSVLATPRGRALRADWRVVAEEPRVRRRWAQELEGSPFARLLTAHEVEVSLSAEGGSTSVALEIEQRLRGWARFAPFLVRRAARRQADEALVALAGLF